MGLNVFHSRELFVGHDLRSQLAELCLGERCVVVSLKLMFRLSNGGNHLMVAMIVDHALLLHLGECLLQGGQ